MVKKSKGKHRLDKFYRLAKEQGYTALCRPHKFSATVLRSSDTFSPLKSHDVDHKILANTCTRPVPSYSMQSSTKAQMPNDLDLFDAMASSV